MALGKLGAFLKRDVSALVKDAGKVLNTDVGSIARGAGRVLKTDLGDLLRDTPEDAKPAIVKVPPVDSTTVAGTKPSPYDGSMVPPPFDPDVTQKMDMGSSAAPSFDPDVTQKMDMAATPPPPPRGADANASVNAQAHSTEHTNFNLQLLLRAERAMPAGNDIKVLLPYEVGDFGRPHATPSGELTNDPVNAVYAARGESVLVQLAACWDADEALQRVDDVLAKLGQAARTTSERNWVIGPTPQGLVYAWTRDCYYFCATSPRGANALARFLSAYPY